MRRGILCITICFLLFFLPLNVLHVQAGRDAADTAKQAVMATAGNTEASEDTIQGVIESGDRGDHGEEALLTEDDILDDSLLEEFDFSDIESFFQQSEDTSQLDFAQLVQELIENQGEVDKKWLADQLFGMAASEWKESRSLFIQILIMCVAFAILNNFAGAFKNSQIHTTCFYMFYLALIMLLMKSYLLLHQVLVSVMERLTDFMEALLPAFCLALSFSAAISTAAVFYQIVVAVIYLIEQIMLNIIIPAVHVYVVLEMLNYMTGESMISNLTTLLKKIIKWALRMMVAAIAGINLIQSLIAPALDGLKNTAVTKMINMIPGIGAAANGVTGMFLGSAIVIKNGIGVAALVVLLILCLGPVVKMAVMTVCYKLTGAVVQPVADKRVCGCISSVGEGAGLLLKILITALMMFVVTIAIITAAVR